MAPALSRRWAAASQLLSQCPQLEASRACGAQARAWDSHRVSAAAPVAGDSGTVSVRSVGGCYVYKAKRAGVPLIYVDPAYTSQMCCECRHIDKRNRVGQGLFICRGCGVVAHADRNASHNIATRGESVWNAGRESRVPATP
ncbi:zinc ribbon domain-containing protein [Streptomyces sp. NBC_00289]|uniref:zinc ribbon domain-containing protein n=1 Tax=Streptomyces sp. NBC_00289 TaxID=2975703 RepID=UPI00352C7F9D